ncbi:LapA family protein [Agrococcus sp. Marseille-P2731]|uniref:LapA family protein n=1 Tax=Agrococcus sp. Marseille-P2731 TaxID=1841862 RepID=UPI0009F86F09|nr:LapA family protein [Agrococcus sp. Marseille-P2731]
MTDTSEPNRRSRELDADGSHSATPYDEPYSPTAGTASDPDLGAERGRSERVGTDRVGTGSTAATPTAAQPRATDARTGSSSRSDSSTTESPAKPRVVKTDPALDSHQSQGVTGATWIALILGTLILILLLIFILQNNVPADFAYFGFAFTLPLGVAMLFAAIAGVLIAALLGSVRLFKLSRRVRRLEKERATIKQAIAETSGR